MVTPDPLQLTQGDTTDSAVTLSWDDIARELAHSHENGLFGPFTDATMPQNEARETVPPAMEAETAPEEAEALEALQELEAILSPRQQERAAARAIKETLVGRAEQGAITWSREQGLTQMRQLMDEWKKAGHAGKGDDERLWQEFSAARDLFFGRLNLERENRKAQMDEAARRKEELCAQAEEAAGWTDLRKAADRLAALMAEWKTVGRAQRDKDDELWRRFKAAQDQVFAQLAQQRRANDAARKQAAAAKTELIAQARALIGAIDLGDARNRMRQLGEDFRAAGFAGRAQNTELNAQFHQARDEFYEWARSETDRRRKSGHRSDYYIRSRKLSDADEVRQEIARIEAELAAAQPSGSTKRQHGTSIRLSLGAQDSYASLSADLIRNRLRLAQLERQVGAIDAKLTQPEPEPAPEPESEPPSDSTPE